MFNEVALPRDSEKTPPFPHLATPLPPLLITERMLSRTSVVHWLWNQTSQTLPSTLLGVIISFAGGKATGGQWQMFFNLSCLVVPRPNYEVTVMPGMHMNHSVCKITDGKQSVTPPTHGCLWRSNAMSNRDGVSQNRPMTMGRNFFSQSRQGGIMTHTEMAGRIPKMISTSQMAVLILDLFNRVPTATGFG